MAGSSSPRCSRKALSGAKDRGSLSVRSIQRQPEPLYDSAQLLDGCAVDRGRGWTHVGRGKRSTQAQEVLADRQSNRRLRLEADQRKRVIEDARGLRAVAAPVRHIDLDQDLRVGEAGHDATGAAAEFLQAIEP